MATSTSKTNVLSLVAQRFFPRKLGGRLGALDPTRVLARGYAFVLDEQQRAVVSAHAVRAGQPLALRWHDGQARVHVVGE